jgi:uncharacterized protein
MANKFCVNLTHSKDDTDRATVGFVLANAALGSGKETCFKKRKLDEHNLVAGATIVGGAKLVEFLSDGSPCVSF